MNLEEDDGKGSEYVKQKLNAALQEKVDSIAEQKKQEEDEKKILEKMKKKEKEIYKAKYAGRLKRNGKPLLEQEREAHQAYQLLLSEHNKKVRSRMLQKLTAVNALVKINSGEIK